MKTLGLIFWVAMFVYGAAYTFPIKIRILKKRGWKTSNDEIRILAKQGDAEAKKLVKATKITMFLGFVGGTLFILTKYTRAFSL